MEKLQVTASFEDTKLVKFNIRRFLKDSLSIQRIAYMSIFTAASVALVLLVNTFVPIIIIQSFRVAFAGIFVKLSGLILGPIAGILSGLFTDLFLLMFRPSDYHPGYTLVLMLFGFFSGLAFMMREKNRINEHKETIFLIVVTLMLSFGVIESFIIYNFSPETILIFNLSFLALSSIQTIAILCGGLGICITLAIFARVNYSKDRPKMNDILIIILLNVFIDFVISQPLISFFDKYSSLGGTPYLTLFISRIGSSSITVLWNTALLFIMWKTLFPIVNRRLYK